MPVGTSAPFHAVAMPAIDLRRLVAAGVLREGVQGQADMAVAQRGAGANMSVDVAPGFAYIKDDHGAGDGFYWAKIATTENIAVTASDPSNPRIDRVGIRIRDTNLGDAADDWTLQVLAGTATAGATLVNLTNAAAVPSNWLLLANILVPAAATTVTTANIDTTLQGVRQAMQLASGRYSRAKTSEKDIVNTNTETDLLNGEFNVPANVLGTTKTATVNLWGDVLQNGGVTAVIKCKFGGTIWWQATLSPTGSANRRSFRISFDIQNLGLTNAQWADGRLRLGAATAATVGYDGIGVAAMYDQGIASTPALLTVDTTADRLVEVTVTWSAAAVNGSWRLKGATLLVG